jgi:hypothetical protein
MRTVAIIDIIRKYGLTSKRLSPKNRIKYEDAVKAVKQYSTSKLEIKEVLDNTRTCTHNNCHCGIPGCGQKIRYEYILEDKDNGNELVAGSTCVWPTLGLSELQAKDFFRYDEVIRNHYQLRDWVDANQDVVDKLRKLRDNNVTYFKAFWEELENAPLLDKDTEYIRSIDVDKEIEKVLYREKFKNVNSTDYDRAVSYLPELVSHFNNNNMIQSFDTIVKSGRRLTGNQFRWLKIMVNRMWYDNNIKGTALDTMNTCEDILKQVFNNVGGVSTTDFNKIDEIEVLVGNESKEVKMAWNLYKIKNAIVH